MEEIRCAVDYLTNFPIVNEDRIGLLGVCAVGSYVMGVAPTEVHAKAIASVSLWDLRLIAQEGWPAPNLRNLMNSLDAACGVVCERTLSEETSS